MSQEQIEQHMLEHVGIDHNLGKIVVENVDRDRNAYRQIHHSSEPCKSFDILEELEVILTVGHESPNVYKMALSKN